MQSESVYLGQINYSNKYALFVVLSPASLFQKEAKHALPGRPDLLTAGQDLILGEDKDGNGTFPQLRSVHKAGTHASKVVVSSTRSTACVNIKCSLQSTYTKTNNARHIPSWAAGRMPNRSPLTAFRASTASWANTLYKRKDRIIALYKRLRERNFYVLPWRPNLDSNDS